MGCEGSAVAQQVELTAATLASHVSAGLVLVGALAVLLPIQLLSNMPGYTTQNSPSTWAANTHRGDPGRVPGFWLLASMYGQGSHLRANK